MATLSLLVWEVSRLPVALISGAAVAAMLAAASGRAWTDIAVHALPITLLTMAAFVFNDLYDREKDRIAEAKWKPIADGRVTIAEGYLFGVVLSAGALMLAKMTEQERSFFIILATLCGVVAYSFIARRVPVIKGFVTAALCCAPLAYGSEVVGVAVSPPIYSFFAAFVVGRELVLDAMHFQGDTRAGMRTLVAYLGPGVSRLVGWATMAGSVIVLTLYAHGIGRAGFVAALTSLAVAGWIGLRNEARGVLWTRLTLLLGVMSGALAL